MADQHVVEHEHVTCLPVERHGLALERSPDRREAVQNSRGAFGISGDTRKNETLWPALNSVDDLRLLVIEVSFPDELEELATQAGHYCPKTMTRDLEKLRHDPDIWITGMKPGSEDLILDQVMRAAPDKRIQMLSRGTVLTV